MGLISRVSSRTYRTDTKSKNMSNLENQGFNARKCSASGKLIGAKDHASIQLNVAEVDENGRMTGANVTYAICGNLRKMGESDDAINRLATSHGIVKTGVFLISDLKVIN